MKIRKAKLSDSAELVKLIQKADNRKKSVAEDKVKKYTGRKGWPIFVAEDKDKLMGYVFVKEEDEDDKAGKYLDLKKYASVVWIAVSKSARKKGLGSKLLDKAIKYAKKVGKKGIWLDCRSDVLEFYEKNGFENVGVFKRKTSSGKLKNCYVMLKKLR
jgi:ribosomal protein S18 acetylase RimI-like enzyme